MTAMPGAPSGRSAILPARPPARPFSRLPRAAAGVLALGLVAAPAPAAEPVRVVAELTGAQVIGSEADTDGSGRFIATLDARSRQLCYEIEVRLIGQATAATIFAGRAGRPAAAGLVSLTPPDPRGSVRSCQAVPSKVAKQLASDPSALHVSIYNMRYPAGALRGQLAAGGPGLSAVEGDEQPLRLQPSANPAPPPREGGYTGPTFTGS